MSSEAIEILLGVAGVACAGLSFGAGEMARRHGHRAEGLTVKEARATLRRAFHHDAPADAGSDAAMRKLEDVPGNQEGRRQ